MIHPFAATLFAFATTPATEEVLPGVLRTPDERFADLPGYLLVDFLEKTGAGR